jgi:tetracycline 7-halogenase / FADH2 O2-dependent halogenase
MPLFSTGILLTLSFIARFAPAAKEALVEKNWDIERFRPIESAFFTEVDQIDRLVSGVIRSFRNYEVLKQYWRNWVIGSLAQFGGAILLGGAPRGYPLLYGAGVPEYREDLRRMNDMVYAEGGDDLALAGELKEILDKWFERLGRPLLTERGDWNVGSDRASLAWGDTTNVPNAVQFYQKLSKEYAAAGQANLENLQRWISEANEKHKVHVEKYRRSQKEGTDFHKAYDRVLYNAVDFDYPRFLRL